MVLANKFAAMFGAPHKMWHSLFVRPRPKSLNYRGFITARGAWQKNLCQ
jgi:hypothetical protein